jgi:hypothetical protein
MDHKQKELVDFLKRRVFEPVLRSGDEGRSEADRRKLHDVQDATRAEIDRFDHYGSAQELVVNFKRDLSSEPAKKIHRESKQLGLPTLNDVRDEFERKVRDLGLNA